MQAAWDKGVSASPDVLVQYLPDGEAVFLDLRTERYFGLNEVGTRMWQALETGATLEEACQSLLEEYDTDPQTLRSDLQAFLDRLVSEGLVSLEQR